VASSTERAASRLALSIATQLFAQRVIFGHAGALLFKYLIELGPALRYFNKEAILFGDGCAEPPKPHGLDPARLSSFSSFDHTSINFFSSQEFFNEPAIVYPHPLTPCRV
jgi:hypothetical protein